MRNLYKGVLILLSLILSVPVMAQSLTGLDNTTYTQGSSPTIVDSDVTLTGDDDFTGGYVEFEITNSTANDQLSIIDGGSLTVSGNAVYWAGDRIGTIDNTKNGQNGNILRIDYNTSAPLSNSSFETASLDSWTVNYNHNQMYGQAWAEGPYNGTRGDGNPTIDDYSYGTASATVESAAAHSGSYGLKLSISGGVTTSCGTNHSPSVTSDVFAATVGDDLSLWWYAATTSDDYDVFGFVFSDDNNNGTMDSGETYQRLFHSTGANTGGWQNISTTLTFGGPNLRFWFINGTYDQTCGRAVGSYMYIDDIVLTFNNPQVTTNNMVETVIEHLAYENQCGPDATTRNLQVRINDGSGSANASSQIDIIEVLPTASCKNISVSLDVNGAATIAEDAVDNGSIGSSLTYDTDMTTFDCTDIGTPVAVVLTVTDCFGNTDQCNATVTVSDDLGPTANLQNFNLYLDSNGDGTLAFSDVDNGSVDACGIANTVVSPSSYSLSDIGANTVTITLTDNYGNVTTETTTVTVIDNTPPTVVGKDITVQLDATGNLTISGSDLDNGSSDASGIASYTATPNSFDCSDVGANNVTLEVTDNNGNSATSTVVVTVEDNVAPAAVCQDITIYLDSDGDASIAASDIDNGSTDACGISSLAISPSAFTSLNVGDNAVTLTVTDVNGNVNTCSSTVEVLDTISPVATAKDITVSLDGNGQVTITGSDVDNGSNDASGIASLVVSPNSFDCSEIGGNTITLTVTDKNGNTSSTTADVTVEDNMKSVVLCKDTTLYLDADGLAGITTAEIDNGSTDNCGIDTMYIDKYDYTGADLGANSITLTVVDNFSNTETCTATVTVLDTINPVAVCMDTTVYLDASGAFTIDPSFVNYITSDNYTYELSLDVTDFDCSNVGENAVVLTATDQSDNTDQCQAAVTVLDTIAPIAMCKDITISLDTLGSVIITPEMIDNGSYDACTDVVLAVESDTAIALSCEQIGDNELTLSVTDIYGNVSTCVSTVTIEDNSKPIAICKDVTVYLDETGFVQIDGSTVDNGSYDACGFHIVPYVNREKFYCDDLGPNLITLTVNDYYMNYDFCESIVTVADSIRPEIDSMEDITTVVASADDCSAVVEFETPTASDICGGVTVEQTAGLGSGSEFPVGATVVTFTATDASGNTSESSFVVTVAGINKAPVFDAVADQSISLYATTLDVPLTGISAGDDCMEQVVSSITAEADPSLVTGAAVTYIEGEETAVLTVTLAGEVSGSSEITVTLKDDAGTANGGVDETSTSFTLTVLPNTTPDAIGSIDTVSIDKNSTETLELPVKSDLFNDTDEGDELTITATAEDGSALPDWVSMNEADMKLTLSPTADELGEHKFILTATDKMGATASVEIIVVVQIPTGFDELISEFGYRVYPNPTDGFIKVDVKNGDLLEGEIFVRNLVGQEIHRQVYQLSDPIMINLSGQVDGIYFVTMKLGDKEFTEKIIKK